MRAAVLWGVGERMDVRDDVEVDDPGPGEVLVEMAASGVCHSDLSVRDGLMGGAAGFPLILGHEGAGTIVAVGAGVENVAVGDRVILSWVPPCGKCRFCLGGQANLCVDGMRTAAGNAPRYRVGGASCRAAIVTATFAHHAVVPASAAIRIDDDVPLDIAALIGCAVMTGVGAALNTARVVPGSSVVVFGIGGVGVNVLQGARAAGAAEIVAVDTQEAKLDVARRFGATHAVLPADLPDVRREVTGGDGFDYAFEVVGRPATIRAAWDATRRGGTTVIVGAGSHDMPVEFNAFELFYQERKLLGSVYGSADVRVDFTRLLRMWRTGRLDLEGLVTRRIGLDGIDDAFDAMGTTDVVRSVVVY